MKRSDFHRAIVAIAMMLIGWLPSLAHDFEVDGVFYNKTSDNTVAVTYKGDSYSGYSEYAGDVVIPSSVDYNGATYSVTSIGYYAFRDCSSLTSIEIPNSVTSIGGGAFSGCSRLTSIQIPNRVTSIGNDAFFDCESLTSIQIPNRVTSIGYDAFRGCSSLTSIVVDAGNSIYDSRNDCNAIIETASNTLIAGCQNTIIPNSVTSIGYWAFDNCDGLTSLEIPNSITSIGYGAFNRCTSLTSIQIPNSVTSIEYMAFGSCSSLTSIEIPNSVKSIGDEAFRYCSGLTDVVIGNSVTSIGNDAFFDCESLTKITCSATNPPTIETNTFSNYSADLFVPAGCKESYEAAEYWNKFTNIIEIGIGTTFRKEGLNYIIIKEGQEVAVAQYDNDSNNNNINKYSGDIVIPQNVEYGNVTYNVTSIGEYAFYECENLTSIEIPNSVTSIGNFAFYWCTSLTSIDIPNSVTSIGNFAFRNCTILTDVVIGNSVTSIGEWAFSETGLTSVEIPNSVSQIGIAAFSFNNNLSHISVESGNQVYDSRENCNAIIETSSNKLIAGCNNSKILNSITTIGDRSFIGCNGIIFIAIPNTVTNIELGAFAYCENLTNIEIPNSVIEIGESVFEKCTSLSTIEIPNSVTEIKKRLFYGCRNLTNVVIPNSVNTIGRFAFAECYSLTSIEIPNLVTSIDSSVFENCTNLANIVVGSGNPKYDSRNGCNAIIETASNTLIIGCQNTIIPNDVASIGNYAFHGCSSLTSIEIPNSVTSIGRSAFSSCSSLIDVVIGNSVTSIGDYAFGSCTSLTEIICLATTPPTITSDTFTKYSADLYVPAGCKEAYEAAEYWNKFTNIIEIEEPNVNLFIDDFAINAGETKELAINLTNEIAFTGFQADLCLPDGLEIEQEEGDYIFELTDRKGSDHVITSGKQANGAIRILCFSTKLNEFSGSEGAIVKFRVTAANDFVGNYEINIKDIILAQSDESEYQLSATTTKVEARMLAKSITLDKTEVSLEATQTTTLLATILPDNTSVKTVVWTSSDEDVAVVDENGVVTAIAIGEATITATTTDGTNLSASCKVTVVPTPGDVNNDAVINVTDIMVVASYILGNTPEGFVFEAADVTKDGKINIIDIVAIANIILNGGTASNVSSQRCAPNTSDAIKIEDFVAGKNQSQQVAIEMTNASDYLACQMDIRLPKGMSIAECELASAATDHMVAYRELPDGAVRVLVYSLTCRTLPDSEVGIIRLRTTTDNRFEGGEIVVENILFADCGQNEYRLYDSVANVNLATGVSATDMDCVVYAENQSIVIISPCDQQATITSVDGVSRTYTLNEGRNEIKDCKRGIYIIETLNRINKLIIK